MFRSKYKRTPSKGRRTTSARAGWSKVGPYGYVEVKYTKDYVYTRKSRKKRRRRRRR